MTEANVSRQLLAEAVAALEAQADRVEGDEALAEAVQTALDVLRHRLAIIRPADNLDTDRVAILVADLSGFTTLAERQDAERVQEAINAMWQVLDAVVTSWGGQVELHAGDSLVALFGHPHPRRGDIERALFAALTIRSELALFNDRARRSALLASGGEWVTEWPGPVMRIGVHAGPLVLTSPDAGRQRIMAGETLRTAQLLEHRAAPDEVLTSQPVWQAAQSAFQMEPAPDDGTGLSAYRVVEPRRSGPPHARALPDDLPLLAGRRDELEFLEQRFQLVADAQALHTVLLLAEAGGGKSRLIYELERQLRAVHGSINVLRASAPAPPAPFALVRDMLANRLDLRPQYSRFMKANLIEDALERLAARTDRDELKDRSTGASVGEAAALLSRLLTPQAADNPGMDEMVSVNEIVLGIVAGDRPTLLVLEDIHLADRESLELVEALRRTATNLPLLIVATADQDIDKREELVGLEWLQESQDPFANHARLHLPPLSAVDSRLLAMSMLGDLSSAPLRLVDLLVAEAGGNPLHVEQLIELFIGAGVIRTGEIWAVDMDKAERLPLPRSLTALIQQRVAQLPDEEQRVLTAAAVFGDTFWDEAVSRVLLGELDLTVLDEILARLVERRLLTPRMTADLGAARAYRFQRRLIAGAVYDSLPFPQRSQYHRRAAAWLRALPSALQQRSWLAVSDLADWHETRQRATRDGERSLAASSTEEPAPTGTDRA